MKLSTDSEQDQRVAAAVQFYMANRDGATVQVDDMLRTSATSDMCLRDARNHDGPFKGLKSVSVRGKGHRTTDFVLVAPNGEELHLHVH